MKCMWTINPEGQQRGFSVPAAIFILVILAMLGAFLVTMSGSQQLGHAQDVAGSRVFQAARAGVEWGIYQVVNTTGTFRSNCNAAGANATLPALDNMAGITVNVTCSAVAYNEGATAFHSYQITSTACNSTTCPNTANPGNLYVERRLVTLVTN